jgi:hypothetical protein
MDIQAYNENDYVCTHNYVILDSRLIAVEVIMPHSGAVLLSDLLGGLRTP